MTPINYKQTLLIRLAEFPRELQGRLGEQLIRVLDAGDDVPPLDVVQVRDIQRRAVIVNLLPLLIGAGICFGADLVEEEVDVW